MRHKNFKNINNEAITKYQIKGKINGDLRVKMEKISKDKHNWS